MIKFYTGSAPANPQTAATGTLLATFILSNPAFGDSASGVATANTPAVQLITTTGTAGWGRLLKSDGTTVVADLSVGTSGTDIVLTTLSFVEDDGLSQTSFTYTQNE